MGNNLCDKEMFVIKSSGLADALLKSAIVFFLNRLRQMTACRTQFIPCTDRKRNIQEQL